MITLNNSLKVASKILLELQNDERSGKVDAYVMTYDNGREQGYRLNVSREKDSVTLTVAFAENRGSDEIVVYNSIGFIKISNEFYESRKFFNYNCIDEAVDYIFSVVYKFVGIEE